MLIAFLRLTDYLAGLTLYYFQELVKGVGKLLDTLLLQDLRYVLVVHPDLAQPLDELPRLIQALLDGALGTDVAVVYERFEGRIWHGVHRVGACELLNVHHVPVFGILRRGRGPERALLGCTLRLQELPVFAGEDLLERLVGELGVRYPELAFELVVATYLVEPPVGFGVDSRDEETRHARHQGRVAACRHEPLEAPDIRRRNCFIAG